MELGVSEIVKAKPPDPVRLSTSRLSVPEPRCCSIRGSGFTADAPSLVSRSCPWASRSSSRSSAPDGRDLGHQERIDRRIDLIEHRRTHSHRPDHRVGRACERDGAGDVRGRRPSPGVYALRAPRRLSDRRGRRRAVRSRGGEGKRFIAGSSTVVEGTGGSEVSDGVLAVRGREPDRTQERRPALQQRLHERVFAESLLEPLAALRRRLAVRLPQRFVGALLETAGMAVLPRGPGKDAGRVVMDLRRGRIELHGLADIVEGTGRGRPARSGPPPGPSTPGPYGQPAGWPRQSPCRPRRRHRSAGTPSPCRYAASTILGSRSSARV